MFKTVSWRQFRRGEYDDSEEVVVNLEIVYLPMRVDYNVRNKNVEAGRKLCGRCNGTGNELYVHYKECEDCDGKGYE